MRLSRLAPLALAATMLAPAFAHAAPIPVRVVVVTTFEIGKDTGDAAGEFQNWVEKLPLSKEIPAPGTDHGVMRYNPQLHVLGIASGEGPSHMASAITALALDQRFDLRHAYFVLAGIGGIDPNFGAVGAAVWAPAVINGGLSHLIDPREIPADWPDGFTPVQGSVPDEKPCPPLHSGMGDMAYTLDPGLVQWAYDLTRSTPLPDSEPLQKIRARYTGFPKAQTPPSVMLGDTISGETFWVGAKMNKWAERWVAYWTDGAGTMATTAEEDIGFMQALTAQSKAGRVDARRALILRTASNYDMPPPGQTAAELLKSEASEGAYSGFVPSLDAAWRVGSVVVRELATHWDKYKQTIPSAAK